MEPLIRQLTVTVTLSYGVTKEAFCFSLARTAAAAKVIDQAESIADILAYEQSGIYILRQMRYFGMYLPNMTVDDVKATFK